MDLSALDTRKASNAGAKIELKHPVNKQGLGNYVHILGKDSDAFRDWVRKKINADRLKEFAAKRKKNDEQPTLAEADEDQSIRLVVSCTVGFSCDAVTHIEPAQGFPSDAGYKPEQTVVDEEGGPFLRMPDGTKLTFSADNAAQLFKDFPEIFRQVNEGIGDLENFIKG